MLRFCRRPDFPGDNDIPPLVKMLDSEVIDSGFTVSYTPS